MQLLAPLVAMMPRPHERVDADSALGTSGASRLLGAVLIVAAMAGVAFVAWVAYQALGALAPELALVYRVVIVSVGIGVLVALLGQAVTRRWGRHVDDSVISGSMRANLTATGRLAIPFVAAFAVLWAFTEALNRIAPGLDRVWTVATVALGLAVLAVPLTAAFQRWRSQTADKLSLATLAEGLAGATRIALPIIIACGAAGMIVGIITLTGLGHELAAGLVSLGQGYLVPVMFLSMLACLVLGIGLPTTANYVITATLAAPAILLILQGDLDEPTMAMLLMAHLFVYYFGVMADITPPVCLAAYAACGISGGNPIRTGVQAVRIAVSGFVVPFMFVLNPELLLQNVTWLEGFTAALSAAAGASLVGIAVTGYLHRRINWLQRLVLAGCGLLLLQVGWLFDALGIAIAAAVIGLHRWRARHAERASEPVSLDAA